MNKQPGIFSSTLGENPFGAVRRTLASERLFSGSGRKMWPTFPFESAQWDRRSSLRLSLFLSLSLCVTTVTTQWIGAAELEMLDGLALSGPPLRRDWPKLASEGDSGQVLSAWGGRARGQSSYSLAAPYCFTNLPGAADAFARGRVAALGVPVLDAGMAESVVPFHQACREGQSSFSLPRWRLSSTRKDVSK